MPLLEPVRPSSRRPRQQRQVFWRRRALALAALLAAVAVPAVLIVRAVGGGEGDGTAGANAGVAGRGAPKPPPPPQLPRGGRTIFPAFRVVAYYGNPRADQLGVLGIGTPAQAARKLRGQARGYQRRSRPVLPAFELISTVVSSSPGDDGKYRYHENDATIRRYLKAARRAKALLVLDVQPGRAGFVAETRRLRKWLKLPDVGLALDPEWRMAPGQVPGKVIGSVSADEVNATSNYVAEIVKRYDLPEKLFVIHQFTPDMIREKPRVKQRAGLAVTMNVDGFGTPEAKLDKYRAFTSEHAKFHNGYKLFYEEDTNRMTPRQVMRMKPRPDFIVYE